MAKKKKVVIVVPTIREQSIKRFLQEWQREFFGNKNFNVHLILVEDNPTKTFKLLYKKSEVTHYSWEDIEKDLGKKSWIIPRRTDCVRSYGYFKAYKMNPDMIITLDDDCYPLAHYLKDIRSSLINMHWNALYNTKSKVESMWISTISDFRPRGIPYKNFKKNVIENTVLNHGLWYNVPDFDGTTQLKAKKTSGLKGYAIQQRFSMGKFFPMCGMNIAWKKEVTPAMFFLLMGQDKNGRHWGYDRFGDIWCGIFLKKISDHLGFGISSGDPIIWHDRASNPLTNIKKEKTGLRVNEYLWQKVDEVRLTSKTFKDCYYELAHKLNLNDVYWKQQKKAMKLWTTLY